MAYILMSCIVMAYAGMVYIVLAAQTEIPYTEEDMFFGHSSVFPIQKVVPSQGEFANKYYYTEYAVADDKRRIRRARRAIYLWPIQFMAYIVYGLYSYGLYSYGVYSYGACSYGAYSYGAYSYGVYSYGLYSYGLYSYGVYSYGPCCKFRIGACAQSVDIFWAHVWMRM